MAASNGPLRGEYTFLPQERVIFGVGSLSQLPEEIARIGAVRALIVTGATLASETDVIVSVSQALGSLHAGTFAGVRQHTPGSGVAQAIEAARALDADVLISVGGGSPIDAAKAVAMELARERGVFPPQIALPTTLSAAEFSHSAGVTDEQRRAKAGFADPHVAPRIVILDAGLTLATPMQLWLSSGIRALDHAIETLYAPNAHPINDVLAIEAIRRLFAGLPRTMQRPDDLDVRTDLQLGAWMSFFGQINTTMGLSHNLGRRMGATYGVPHGITSCITLPHVMRHFARRHTAALAVAGRTIQAAEAGADDLDAALFAADAVADLIARLGLPRHLSEVGVAEGNLRDIALATVGDGPQALEVEDLLRKML
ncbi:MAG: iron-containing alcohol dehydrogenase [Roseiflexaceae bacterium]